MLALWARGVLLPTTNGTQQATICQEAKQRLLGQFPVIRLHRHRELNETWTLRNLDVEMQSAKPDAELPNPPEARWTRMTALGRVARRGA